MIVLSTKYMQAVCTWIITQVPSNENNSRIPKAVWKLKYLGLLMLSEKKEDIVNYVAVKGISNLYSKWITKKNDIETTDESLRIVGQRENN
jgi:hypothetical protein